MKRFRLPTKLALAIVPIGVVALVTGALVSWTFLEEARAEERVSYAARVAAEATDALVAVSAERTAVLEDAFGESTANQEARRNASDRALEALRDSVRELVPRASGPASGIAGAIFSHSSLAQARLEDAREGDPLSEETQELYDEVGNRLITVASQSTLYFGDAGPAREGAGAVSLARASFASFQQEQLLTRFLADESLVREEEFEQRFAALEATVVDWLTNAEDNSPTVRFLGLARSQVIEDGAVPDAETFLFQRDEELAGAASEILGRVAGAADRNATTVRTEAATVAAVVLGVLFVTVVMALVLGRSTVRRVRSVTSAAQHVADVELPKLVDALSNPKGQLDGSIPVELEQAGPDEVGELATSFSSLHSTLVEVANRQMEILRRGVSEIFVTLARRNGSLVDRQLALIDELESRQEDPEILDGYYKLDHLATRMRRNAESLLVLAGSESPRMWSDPLDMGEVVRAALGEVDEYQRVDVLALEPARLKGKVVTDLAHLMSELLDNATQFSPPSERVRVTGLFDDDGYVITIADRGLGISDERLEAINRVIVDPPVLGLALEPTLGMYVVARLAARHGIAIRLVPGVPGTTVRITLPRSLLETTTEKRPENRRTVPPVSNSDNGTPSEPKSASIPPYAFRSGAHPPTDGRPALDGTGRKEPPKTAPLEEPTRSQDADKPEPTTPSRSPEGPPTAKGEKPASGAPSPSPVSPPAASLPRRDEAKPPGERRLPDPPREPPTPASPPAPRPAAPPVPSDGGLPRRQVTHPQSGDIPARPPSPSTPPPARPSHERPAHERTAQDRPAPTARPVDSLEGRPPSQSPGSRGGLPTRTPGASFQGEVGGEGSSSVSQRGAEGIRNALDGYRLGRDIATNPPKHPREGGEDEPEQGGER